LAALVYPLARRELAKRHAVARVDRLRADTCPVVEDTMLAFRLRRLGPLLSSWETIGGCGAGGASGVSVMWVGRNTTGGLFLSSLMNNYIVIPPSVKPGQGGGGFNDVVNLQLGKDFLFDPWNGSWNFSLVVPYVYKHYYSASYLGDIPVTNAGLGDMNVFLSRKLGADNSTMITLIGGIPTGTYRAEYQGTPLTPDEQLGFGRLTATLQVQHTFDRDWGLMITGANVGYRGGRQTDKFLWFWDQVSQHNYRAPSASAFGYAGYFWGPLVPAVGAMFTGYTAQDTRGDFGETLDAPVATLAAHASLEWSNPYVAVLGGVLVPFAMRGTNWSTSPTANYGRYLQPWTLALAISASPF
jgi:hypothetical protein